MQELNVMEIDEVGGGKFIWGYVVGKAFDWVVDSVMAGKVDYAGAAEASGSGYCMLGA